MNVKDLRWLTILTVIITFVMPSPTMAFEMPASINAVITEDDNLKKVTKKKITDRSHPDYKRCRREPVIGSLARMRTVCMTNREWEEYARAGNAGARSILDDVNKGG